MRDLVEPTDIHQLHDHSCVVYGSDLAAATWPLRVGGSLVRVPVTGRFAANHLNALRLMTLAGLGIALLPLVSCRDDLKAKRLRTILPNAVPRAAPIWIVHAATRLPSPAVRLFIEHLRRTFDPTMGVAPKPSKPTKRAKQKRASKK